MSNFHPLEVMGRGSETQLQVGENFKKDNLAGKWLSQFHIPKIEAGYCVIIQKPK